MIRFGSWLLSGLLALAAAAPAQAQTQTQTQTFAQIPPLTSPVVDTTGTLTAAEVAQLEQQALALQQRKGSQLQILIVPTARPEAIEQYAQRVFDQWKLGRSGVDDGVLLLVAKDDREVRIQPGYGLEGAIPDITAGRIVQEYLVPKFRVGDFAGGLLDASGQLVRLIEGEPLPEPMTPLGSSDGDKMLPLPIGVFAGFWFAFIVRFMLNGLPRPLRALSLAAVAGGIAWLITFSLLAAAVAAAVGFVIGLITVKLGQFARSGGISSGSVWSGSSNGSIWSSSSGTGRSSWPSSSGSSRSSGGWSGGGGRSGGGGASGRW
jgi:uncharacterized protein